MKLSKKLSIRSKKSKKIYRSRGGSTYEIEELSISKDKETTIKNLLNILGGRKKIVILPGITLHTICSLDPINRIRVIANMIIKARKYKKDEPTEDDMEAIMELTCESSDRDFLGRASIPTLASISYYTEKLKHAEQARKEINIGQTVSSIESAKRALEKLNDILKKLENTKKKPNNLNKINTRLAKSKDLRFIEELSTEQRLPILRTFNYGDKYISGTNYNVKTMGPLEILIPKIIGEISQFIKDEENPDKEEELTEEEEKQLKQVEEDLRKTLSRYLSSQNKSSNLPVNLTGFATHFSSQNQSILPDTNRFSSKGPASHTGRKTASRKPVLNLNTTPFNNKSLKTFKNAFVHKFRRIISLEDLITKQTDVNKKNTFISEMNGILQELELPDISRISNNDLKEKIKIIKSIKDKYQYQISNI